VAAVPFAERFTKPGWYYHIPFVDGRGMSDAFCSLNFNPDCNLLSLKILSLRTFYNGMYVDQADRVTTAVRFFLIDVPERIRKVAEAN
jgi:hypothetical protein